MIEKVTTAHGEVSFSPERGGMITSLVLKGKEIFYLDKTILEVAGPVRGGIPILFPNAGELVSAEFPLLARHGFVRDMPWASICTENNFTETLVSNEKTREIFPFDFELSVTGMINSDQSFSLDQSVKNLETKKRMPLSMGLHPYFSVRHDEKKDIKFNFEGGQEIEQKIDVWAHGGTVSVANPGVPFSVSIPETGEIQLKYSKEYQRILIWSEEGKDFVCIEPVMRDAGGLVDDPELVEPGETFTGTVKIELKD